MSLKSQVCESAEEKIKRRRTYDAIQSDTGQKRKRKLSVFKANDTRT